MKSGRNWKASSPTNTWGQTTPDLGSMAARGRLSSPSCSRSPMGESWKIPPSLNLPGAPTFTNLNRYWLSTTAINTMEWVPWKQWNNCHKSTCHHNYLYCITLSCITDRYRKIRWNLWSVNCLACIRHQIAIILYWGLGYSYWWRRWPFSSKHSTCIDAIFCCIPCNWSTNFHHCGGI